jgi:hypothetical protein
MNTLIPVQSKELNYCIAWFRLHEAALKNEHERAFLNYRLLIHSYDNIGFQHQIEGELHLLFLEYALAAISFKKAFLIYFYNQDYINAFLTHQRIENLTHEKLNETSQLQQIINQNRREFNLFLDE